MSIFGVRSWLENRAIISPSLVCPVRILWQDYEKYVERWGFDPWPAEAFVQVLEHNPNIVLKEGGRGKLQKVANGIGVRQIGEEYDSHHARPRDIRDSA